MNFTTFVVTICVAGFATYLTRYPGLLLGRVFHATPRIERGLRYIPIGIFAAMVAPVIFLHPAYAHGHFDIPFFAATFVALVTAWWTRNPLWTMLFGVITIAILRALIR